MSKSGSGMPDVPWHIGYPLKDPDDPSRHPSYCKYYNKYKNCTAKGCGYFGKRCRSSIRCPYYKDKRVKADSDTVAVIITQGNSEPFQRGETVEAETHRLYVQQLIGKTLLRKKDSVVLSVTRIEDNIVYALVRNGQKRGLEIAIRLDFILNEEQYYKILSNP